MEKIIKTLLVEDEEALGMVVSDSLRSRGFDVTYCKDGESALQMINETEFDVLVLDVMLPKMDGFSLARQFRKANQKTPIIFLTARSQTEDVVEGFKLGGNDYLKKPFSLEELIVRIKALVNRFIDSVEINLEECYIGKYKFNIKKQTLELNEKIQTLTHREVELLTMLFEKKNQVLDRQMALKQLWGDDSFFNARSMDVFITRLRKHLRDDPEIQIVNIRGLGYKLII